jgi:hypothetical protein
MKDFVPGGTHSMIHYDESSNYILQKQDLLAPVIINWKETSSIVSSDGKKVSGLWYVDYYETAAPWIARQIAREYFIRDKLGGNFEKLVSPEVEADYVALYNSFGITTAIIQKNCVIVQAKFIGFSEYELPTESWIRILSDSIK